MKVIKLKIDDFNILKENSQNKIVKDYRSNCHFDEQSQSWILLLELEDIEIVADELFNILITKGTSNGEINSFGKSVDNLIDKFNYYDE